MKKNLFLVCLWGVLLFLSACTTLQPVTYERLQPADVSFPEQIRKVGIVNNMPVIHQNNKQVSYASVSLEGDGSVAVEALAQEVVAVNYFDQVIIYDGQLRENSQSLDQPIPKDTIDCLIRTLEVDMLLAMERVSVDLKESTMFIPERYGTVPAVDGVVTSVVRAYLEQREEPLFTVQKTDTLSWEFTPKLTYGDVIKDVSEYAASMPIQNLLPYWKELDRYYFDGGNVEMRDAGIYVREQNWEEAAKLWRRLYEKKKGKVCMRAAFNLALFCEMNDDFEQALKYLDDAAACVVEESPEAVLILYYRSQLNNQMDNKLKLRIQMKRFENIF